MDWEKLFNIVNALALVAWIALVFLPRRDWLTKLIRFGVIGVLAAFYSTLVFLYLFQGGGNFTSLAGVRSLFATDPVLLAGWVHYLAFDLFVGVWLAERLDGQRVSRLLQAPILAATFMAGPLGLLLGLSPTIFRSERQPVAV